MSAHEDDHFVYTVICDKLRFCGCGNPDLVFDEVIKVLRACPLYEGNWQPSPDLGPIGQELLLYVMSDADLIEHGSSVGGSWITPEGERFLAVVGDRPHDAFDNVGYSCSNCPSGASLSVLATPEKPTP